MKNILIKLTFASLCLIMSSSIFADSGDWEEKFNVGNGLYVTHTPTQVIYTNNATSTECILLAYDVNPGSLIGKTLCVHHTRDQFMKTLCNVFQIVNGVHC